MRKRGVCLEYIRLCLQRILCKLGQPIAPRQIPYESNPYLSVISGSASRAIILGLFPFTCIILRFLGEFAASSWGFLLQRFPQIFISQGYIRPLVEQCTSASSNHTPTIRKEKCIRIQHLCLLPQIPGLLTFLSGVMVPWRGCGLYCNRG